MVFITLGEITIEERDPLGCEISPGEGGKFYYNGIRLGSLYKYDPTNKKLYTHNRRLIKIRIGDFAYNKLLPYLVDEANDDPILSQI
jgi:hypothetical protein